MPRGDHGAHRRRPVLDRVEVHQHRADRRRVRRQADAHLGGDRRTSPRCRRTRRAGRSRRGSGSSPPSTATLPSGSTTSRARTWAFVTPSARQCGPPELLATLPPIEQVCWLLGSGAKCRPCGGDGPAEIEVEHARLDPRPASRRRRPTGCWFIFVVEMTIAPSGGTAPPARPVPEPRATNGTPCRLATCDARLHLGGRRREAHGDGGALHVRGVVAVERQLGRTVAHPVGGERRAAARATSAGPDGGTSAAPSSPIGATHQDHPPDSTGWPSTSTSSPGVEVVAEAHEPPVALGAQLALADAGGAGGPPGRRRRHAGPIARTEPTVAAGHVRRGQPPRRRRRPCAWRSRRRPRRSRRHRRTRPRAALTRSAPQTGARLATCRWPARRP